MQKPKLDYLFLFSVLALSGIGLIMIFSASPTMGIRLGDTYYYIKKHIFYLLLGFTAMYFGYWLDLEKMKKWSGAILLISVLFLFSLYIPGVGRRISGALRWIDFAFISFQPSELIKFSVVLFLANLLAGWKDRITDLYRGFLPPLLLVSAIALVIIAQPDLGTAISLMATAFIMLYAAGANPRHLAAVGGIGLAGLAVLSVTSAYRLRRLIAFIDPWKDPQGVGFHIIQSLLAVGSGGIMGLGMGASRQKFFYLPQQFTDFIFAIICEEMGLIGGAGVIILFALFAARGLRIAMGAPDRFSSLLATGLVSWITIQALINIMVVLGLIPTTGIPLPFISFGGTATILLLFSSGILLNISSTQKG